MTILDLVPYQEIQQLQMCAQLILTDSGGIQKEAYFHQVPCITLRDETEWVETVKAGWNQLVGANHLAIIDAVKTAKEPTKKQSRPYGDGSAAEKVTSRILESNRIEAF